MKITKKMVLRRERSVHVYAFCYCYTNCGCNPVLGIPGRDINQATGMGGAIIAMDKMI